MFAFILTYTVGSATNVDERDDDSRQEFSTRRACQAFESPACLNAADVVRQAAQMRCYQYNVKSDIYVYKYIKIFVYVRCHSCVRHAFEHISMMFMIVSEEPVGRG